MGIAKQMMLEQMDKEEKEREAENKGMALCSCGALRYPEESICEGCQIANQEELEEIVREEIAWEEEQEERDEIAQEEALDEIAREENQEELDKIAWEEEGCPGRDD
jgi:hypothetical protein